VGGGRDGPSSAKNPWPVPGRLTLTSWHADLGLPTGQRFTARDVFTQETLPSNASGFVANVTGFNATLVLVSIDKSDGHVLKSDDDTVATPPRTLMWDGEALLRARAAVASGGASVAAAAALLRTDAAAAFLVKPLSVTSKNSAPAGGDLHDYVSYASYGWPCTAACNSSLFKNCSRWKRFSGHCNRSTGLPWVVRDGYNDPESAQDRPRLSLMLQSVEALSASAFFFNSTEHAQHAALLLRTWFLNAATFMRPNARFAQSKNPAEKSESGGGIIDFSDGAYPGGGGNYIASISLAHMLDSVALLAWAAPNAWTAADMAGLKRWVSTWLSTYAAVSPGDSDKYAHNNHADFYDTLIATCRYFVGNTSAVRSICNHAPKRVDQVARDGSLPAEDRRTKSESYHAFALTALLDLAWICRTAAPDAPDLFRYATSDGRSLLSAVNWLAPYADGKPWDAGSQIIPFDHYDPGHESFITIYRAAAIGIPEHAARFAGVASKQPNGERSRQVLLRPYNTVHAQHSKLWQEIVVQ
jgi:hypothetical protein